MLLRYRYFLLILFTFISVTAIAQLPNEEPPPPPPMADDPYNPRDPRYNKSNGVDETLGNMEGFIEAGIPMLPSFSNIDSMKMGLENWGIATGMLCQGMGNDNSFNTCIAMEPAAALYDPKMLKDHAVAVTILSTPKGGNDVFLLSVTHIIKNSKKNNQKLLAEFRKKVDAVLSYLDIYIGKADLDNLLAGENGGMRDFFNCELVYTVGYDQATTNLYGDVSTRAFIIKSKMHESVQFIEGAINSTDSLLYAELQKFAIFKAAVDSMQYCNDYDEMDILTDSIYYHSSKPTHPTFADFNALSTALRSKFKIANTLLLKNQNYEYLFTGKAKSAKKFYGKAFSFYGSPYPSQLYFFIPFSTKDKKKDLLKKSHPFTKEVLGYFGISFTDSLKTAYENDDDGTFYFFRDNISVSLGFEMPGDDWLAARINVDTLDKKSVAGPFYYISLWNGNKPIGHTIALENKIDSIQDIYNKRMAGCDSIATAYRRSNKFTRTMLPTVTIKEEHYNHALIEVFNTPDTLKKQLKTIFNDTTTQHDYSWYWSKNYIWELYKKDMVDSTYEARSNIIMTYSGKSELMSGRNITLVYKSDKTAPAHDSLKTKYYDYRTKLFTKLGIDVPQSVLDDAVKNKASHYTTTNYCIIFKEDLAEEGVTYKVTSISPLAIDKIKYTPFADEVDFEDTLYHTIPAALMQKALLTADTLWAEPGARIFNNADSLVAKLKASGFNGQWICDEAKFLHFKSKEAYTTYLLDEAFIGHEVLTVVKTGQKASALLLYRFGPAPDITTQAYTDFVQTTHSLAYSLGVETPRRVAQGMINGNSTSDFLTDGLIYIFEYKLLAGYDTPVQIGLAAGLADKLYMSKVNDR